MSWEHFILTVKNGNANRVSFEAWRMKNFFWRPLSSPPDSSGSIVSWALRYSFLFHFLQHYILWFSIHHTNKGHLSNHPLSAKPEVRLYDGWIQQISILSMSNFQQHHPPLPTIHKAVVKRRTNFPNPVSVHRAPSPPLTMSRTSWLRNARVLQ